MRKFRDRDFIESKEGMLFCVVGNTHPQNRVISYLKYIPWREEKVARLGWRKEGKEYGRILPHYGASGVQAVKDYLQKQYPEYVYYDPYLNIEIIGVPLDKIKKHYKPEERAEEIIKNPQDSLEQIAAEIIREISSKSKIPISYLGITGSILVKIHNPLFSDIDLIIYGRSNSIKVKQALAELLESNVNFRRLNSHEIKKFASEISRIHALTFKEATILLRERWYAGIYKNRFFSLHPVKLENEVNEKYGSKIYRSKGMITVKCTVTDAKEAIFLPCKYVVGEVEVIDGPKVKDIREVVSFEGLYCDVAKAGEKIYVKGKLEEVIDVSSGCKYHRIQVGSFEARGLDYIKPSRWLKT